MQTDYRQIFALSAIFVIGLSGCAHQDVGSNKPSCLTPDPLYPLEAKRKGETGRVSILITADRDGKITNAAIDKSSASASLDSAALKSARQTLCRPYYVNGERVAFELKTFYTFGLSVIPPKNGVSLPE